MTKPLRSTIEALEPRIAPATVSHVLANGILKINPLVSTGAVNIQLLQMDADSFLLVDAGAPNVTIDGVKNIQLKLTDLVDSVDLGFNGTGYRGDVSIASGLGADSIDFIGFGSNSVDVTIVSGGASVVTVGNLGLLGDMKITTVNGAFVNNGGIGSLSVTGAANVIHNGGVLSNTKITAPNSGLTLTGTGGYNGDLLIKGGTGLDKVTISGRVDGKATFAAGEGGSQFVGDQAFFVGGRLTVTGGLGTDTVTIGLAAQDPFTTILGSAVFSLGDGNNSVSISGNGRIAGSLRVSSLGGNDGVGITSSSGLLTIGGALQLALGDGQNGLTTNGAILTGGINYLGGVSSDSVTIQTTDVVGAAKFALGNGANTLNLFGSNLDSTLYVKGGADNDTVFFGGTVVIGKATILGGDGNNMTTVAASQLRAGFAYQGGLHQDNVILNADSQFFGMGSMKGGAGNNVLDARTLGAFRSFTYTGGVDTDAVLLGSSGGIIANFKASLGEGNDTAIVDTAVFRTLKIDGGVGTDSLTAIAGATANGAVFVAFENPPV